MLGLLNRNGQFGWLTSGLLSEYALHRRPGIVAQALSSIFEPQECRRIALEVQPSTVNSQPRKTAALVQILDGNCPEAEAGDPGRPWCSTELRRALFALALDPAAPHSACHSEPFAALTHASHSP